MKKVVLITLLFMCSKMNATNFCILERGIPSITNAQIISVSFDGLGYQENETIVFEITFSEEIVAFGSIELLFSNVGFFEEQIFASMTTIPGTPTNTLIFEYTVGNSNQDGSVDVIQLELFGGTIESTSTGEMLMDTLLPPLPFPELINTVPQLNLVSGAPGTYGVGDTIIYTVDFDEDVEVVGMPLLNINIGGVNRTVNYTGGSETPNLTFEYIVVALDNDDAAVGVETLVTNGGSIREGFTGNRDANLLNQTPYEDTSVIVDKSTLSTTHFDVDLDKVTKVYPNPNFGAFSIDIKGFKNRINTISLYNILGKKVVKLEKNNTGIYTIDSIQRGVYFIALDTVNGIITKKVIVN